MTHCTRFLLFLALFAAIACSEQVEPFIEIPDEHRQKDTTSHDMEWEIFRLGKPGISGSTLRDIHALNDTDVWAVGTFLIDAEPDSLGILEERFNAMHWNGREWRFTNINNESFGPTSPAAGKRLHRELMAVWVFGHNDLLTFKREGLVWYNENSTKWGYDPYVHEWKYLKYRGEEVPKETGLGGIEKIWAYSRDDIYFCGTLGAIRRRNDGKWTRINSGTENALHDIYGDRKGQLWTGGYDFFDDSRTFLTVKDDRAYEMNVKDFYGGPVHGHTVYASGDTLYAFIGNAILVQSTVDTTHYRYTAGRGTWPVYGFIESIRGRGNNNIFAAGAYGTILHYNGRSWKMVAIPTFDNPIMFRAITLSENYVYVAGKNVNTNEAIIYRSRLPK
jgi:hypothetical protein